MIKKSIRKVLDLPLLATTSVMAAAAVPTAAQSQAAQSQNIGSLADGVREQFDNLGTLVATAAFLGGLFFAATGLFKLKQAVDTQGQQVKYGDGVWRLALGSALVAFPAVLGVGVGTIFGDSAGVGTGTINFNTSFGGAASTSP